MPSPAGLLLLTGGEGIRLGGPKHLLPHPGGGSWGSHLVGVFETVFPGSPLQILGQPLPDRPELARFEDPLCGPAAALSVWARATLGQSLEEPSRWWVAACDQVRWTPERLRAWHLRAGLMDPGGEAWVIARHRGHLQPLGGFLASSLKPSLARLQAASMREMLTLLPSYVLDEEGDEWEDVDTPEELARWADSPLRLLGPEGSCGPIPSRSDGPCSAASTTFPGA